MIRSRLLTVGSLILAALGVAHAAARSTAETELRKIVQEMLDAVAPGHAEVWRRYMHDRVLRVDETGVVQTKEELLKEFAPLPPGLVGTAKIDTFRIEARGAIAPVAFEMQEHLDYHGQILRSRFRISGTWSLVSSIDARARTCAGTASPSILLLPDNTNDRRLRCRSLARRSVAYTA